MHLTRINVSKQLAKIAQQFTKQRHTSTIKILPHTLAGTNFQSITISYNGTQIYNIESEQTSKNSLLIRSSRGSESKTL
jgi:hypothetical protein